MTLLPIEPPGSVDASAGSVPVIASEVIRHTCALYAEGGYEPPWIGYLAFDGGECVGTCAFKSPPSDTKVEIAYFTFPANEGKGHATKMTAELIRLALETEPKLTIIAQTLPEENASTAVLKKNGFLLDKVVDHPEDGKVWQWRLIAA